MARTIVPGIAPDVGAPVAADLALVAHAAHRDAGEPPAQRAGDRLAQRGLAHARRPDEAQDRAGRVRLQPRHGELLDDPVLDLLDVVVVLVEHSRARAPGRGRPRSRRSTGARGSSRGRCAPRRARPTPTGRRSRRASSRSAAVRTSSGGSTSASALAQLLDLGRASSRPSPSSSRIALSCWRRKNSRWLLSMSVWTSLWIFAPSSSSSSSRLQSTVRRRRRASRSASSSSSWRSATDSRMRRRDQVRERASGPPCWPPPPGARRAGGARGRSCA